MTGTTWMIMGALLTAGGIVFLAVSQILLSKWRKEWENNTSE